MHCILKGRIQGASPWLFISQNKSNIIKLYVFEVLVIFQFLTFFNSIGIFEQTINYFNMAVVVRRGISFNQVKPISCVTNFKKFFAALGRSIKSHVFDLSFVFLFPTVKLMQKWHYYIFQTKTNEWIFNKLGF